MRRAMRRKLLHATRLVLLRFPDDVVCCHGYDDEEEAQSGQADDQRKRDGHSGVTQGVEVG